MRKRETGLATRIVREALWATLLHLYRGNNRVSFGRSELKNDHAIPGVHFEMLLIRGQRTSRGGCHIQVGHNLLPVRENVENAVARMKRRLNKREDNAMRTVSDRNTIGERSGTVGGSYLWTAGPGNRRRSRSSAPSLPGRR